jgi:hypothetical protein
MSAIRPITVAKLNAPEWCNSQAEILRYGGFAQLAMMLWKKKKLSLLWNWETQQPLSVSENGIFIYLFWLSSHQIYILQYWSFARCGNKNAQIKMLVVYNKNANSINKNANVKTFLTVGKKKRPNPTTEDTGHSRLCNLRSTHPNATEKCRSNQRPTHTMSAIKKKCLNRTIAERPL